MQLPKRDASVPPLVPNIVDVGEGAYVLDELRVDNRAQRHRARDTLREIRDQERFHAALFEAALDNGERPLVLGEAVVVAIR